LFQYRLMHGYWCVNVQSTVNPRFEGQRYNRQNSSVIPRYSPADVSVIPRNSLVDMSCVCTSLFVLRTSSVSSTWIILSQIKFGLCLVFSVLQFF
jgi:hypothetical protein